MVRSVLPMMLGQRCAGADTVAVMDENLVDGAADRSGGMQGFLGLLVAHLGLLHGRD